MRGAVAALCDYFDDVVRGWALDLAATEKRFPADISVATLERAGFISAFPEKLVPGRSPAVCYHLYPSLSDSTISDGSIVTAVGQCCRNEYDATSVRPVERLSSFTMREIIAVGNGQLVEEMRRRLIDRVSEWTTQLGLDGRIETAADPFFTSESRGRLLMQQMLPLKYELQLRVAGDGRRVAAASFNNHQQHFGRAFSIRLPSGEYAHSGCVAFGWERWMIAFVNHHGANEANWPLPVESSDGAAID
jgi:seryl-tRNA synthetase